MTTNAPGESFTITITATTTALDHLGHDPRSAYVERFWLPEVGPTSTWLLRMCAYGFDNAPTFDVTATSLAYSVGVGESISRLRSAMNRLQQFAFAKKTTATPHSWEIVSTIPWFDRGRERGLPSALRAEHALWLQTENQNHPEREELLHASRHIAHLIRRNVPVEFIAKVLDNEHPQLSVTERAELSRHYSNYQPNAAA